MLASFPMVDIDVHVLREEDVTKENLHKMIGDKNPGFILLHGHGDHHLMGGFPENVLIQCGENNNNLKDKMIHCLSCKSGQTLGPELVNIIGTKTFFGYKEDFKFTSTTELEDQKNYVEDEMAGYFLNPAFQIIKTLVEGGTAEEALRNSKKASEESINLLNASTKVDVADKDIIIPLLKYNLEHQVMLGSSTATF